MGNGKWTAIDGTDAGMMNWESIAGERIFRPRFVSEVRVRNQSEAHLRARYKPGTYSNRQTINEIIQHQFGFYSNKLAATVENIASRHFMEFLLHQYDLSDAIERSARTLSSTHPEYVRWSQLGPLFRRTLKYLAERIALLAPDEAPKASKEELLDALDVACICSEEIVRLYNLSEQTYSLFPDETRLVLMPPGELNYFELTVTKTEVLQFHERVRFDTANRLKYIPENRFLSDIEQHNAVLADAVRGLIGITYKEALGVLAELNRGATPHPGGFPIPFIHQGNAIEMLANALGFPKESIAATLSGFALTKAKMLEENRVVWKPKQEYRAARRAFFEFPHPTGPHLIWSKKMADEALTRLVTDVAFQKFPPEWTSLNVHKGIAKISNIAGKWFESVFADSFRKLGFQGARSFKDAIGMGGQQLTIPAEIGELDCLGYSQAQELLVLAECKFVRSGAESAFFRDDVSKFGPYAEQLRRKAAWICTNRQAVCAALETVKDFPSEIKPRRIAWVMVTYYPSIASYKIADFPCVSLTEFMVAYEKKNTWPFDTGATE